MNSQSIEIRHLQDTRLHNPSLIGAFLGTLVIHTLVFGAAWYFSQPKQETDIVLPRRVIIATQVPKLGGSGATKVKQNALPSKAPTPSPKADGMPTPIPDPDTPPTPNNTTTTDKPVKDKPSLEDLIAKNAQGKATDEGVGEGTGEGPGVASGSPTGTGLDPNAAAGWNAEVGSLIHTYWTRPSTISDLQCKKLAAELRLTLRDNLSVANYKLKKTSGNDLFDSSLSSALGKMISDKVRFPSPPPEAGISKAALTSGRLVIQFTCEKPS